MTDREDATASKRGKSSFINMVALVLLTLCGCYSPPPPPPPTPPPPALPPARFCAVCSQELFPDLASADWMAGKCFTAHAGAMCVCRATRGPDGLCPNCNRPTPELAGQPCGFCNRPIGADGNCPNDPHLGDRPLVIIDTIDRVRRARAAQAETRRIMSRPTVAAQPTPACPTCGIALVGGRCSLGHLDRPYYGTQPPPPNPNAPCPVCGTAMLNGRCFMAHTRQQPQPQPQPRVNAPCSVCRTPVASDGRCYVDHSTLCPYCGAIKTQQELLAGRCRSCGR